MALLKQPKHVSPLTRYRLELSDPLGAITLATANGAGAGAEAFRAVVYFRDAEGQLIFPPYAGFETIGPGLSGFAVAGGEAAAPAVSNYGFSAPPGAASIEIELRSFRAAVRPQLAMEPELAAGPAAKAAAGGGGAQPMVLVPVTSDTRALTLSGLNGKAGGTKAFLVSVRFLDPAGAMIARPYQGFASSDEFGAFFYLPGGSARAPGRTSLNFVPPAPAVQMELTVHSRDYRGKAALAAVPLSTGISAQASLAAAGGGQVHADLLAQNVASASQGTRLREHLAVAGKRVIGIFSAATAGAIGEEALERDLPYDGYDRSWAKLHPSHLVIEAEALAGRFGWDHALTLRDPPATVELAVMLERARKRGIRTVLIGPAALASYPLLSRVTGLFDQIIPAGGQIALQ